MLREQIEVALIRKDFLSIGLIFQIFKLFDSITPCLQSIHECTQKNAA